MRDKRGVSPVIATVLLVGIVVLLGVIIFLWFNSLQGEAITKFDGQNVEIVCPDVSLDARYDPETKNLYISNIGDVPVFAVNLKTTNSDGEYTTIGIRDVSPQTWPKYGLNPAGVFSDVLTSLEDLNSLTVVPVLRGETDKGQKNYECPESYGYNIL